MHVLECSMSSLHISDPPQPDAWTPLSENSSSSDYSSFQNPPKKSETGRKKRKLRFFLFSFYESESEPEFEFIESKIREFLFPFLGFKFFFVRSMRSGIRGETGNREFTGRVFFFLIVGGKWNKLWNSGFIKFGGERR